MAGDQMKATLRGAVDAWNSGDVDGFLAMFDRSLVHHGLSPEPLDAAGNRAFYEGLAAGFPASRLVLDDVVAEEDRLAVRFHFAGDHSDKFMNMAPTGRSVQIDAQTILKFRSGRVVERWTTADFLGLVHQLS